MKRSSLQSALRKGEIEMTLMSILPLYRDIMCFLTIILFLLCIVDAILAFQEKNKKEFLVSVLLFICSYAIHQVLKTVIYFQSFGKQEQLARICGDISAWVCLAVILILFGLGLTVLQRLMAWKRNHISQTSVKESIDNLPSGLAFYENDGNCLLVNHTMNRISSCLTGHAVLDGRELERVCRDNDMLIDMGGMKYQIVHRHIPYNKGSIHELVADDVTELHQKTEALSMSNAELAEMAGKMKKYSLYIDESVHNQEILQAKVNIHDEMNRLLLATDNAASGNASEEDLKKILFTWKNNALLLCKEADIAPTSNTRQDLETLANIIGIKIEWDGRIKTRDSRVLQLFEFATREALNNAAKHAKADCLNVIIRESEDLLCVTYTNNGICSDNEVRPAGGLKNLLTLLERAGGDMSVKSTPVYTLMITIPKGGKENAI